MRARVRTAVVIAALAALVGCEREARRFALPPHVPDAASSPAGALHAAGPPGSAASVAWAAAAPSAPASGAPPTVVPVASAVPAAGDDALRAQSNAWAVAQGKRWFRWYNCNGCHANGGGGMGPPLMDATWRYGSAPAEIAASIREGRPNGMPAFAGRIPDDQLGQLVAFIRSMSGQLRTDVAPSRNDALSPGVEPENRRERLVPRREGSR